MDRVTPPITLTLHDLAGTAAAPLGRYAAGLFSNGAEMHVNALGHTEVEAVERLTQRLGHLLGHGLVALFEERQRMGLPPVSVRRCPRCDVRRLVAEGDDPTCPGEECCR